MLVLHGFWSPERGLCVWAEDSERAVTGRSQALRSAHPHPFAASVEMLTGVCSGEPGEATLQLPSLAKSPLDSPELIRVTPRGARSEPVLLSWRVPTIELEPAGALAWLATAADGGADGVRWGASLRYLIRKSVGDGRTGPTAGRGGWRSGDGVRRWSGGGFEGDLVAEGFELAEWLRFLRSGPMRLS